MKKIVLIVIFSVISNNWLYSNNAMKPLNDFEEQTITLAKRFNINYEAIRMAMSGYEKLKQLGKITNQRYLSIADFSKPSSEERLFIIDLQLMDVVLKTFVAHGRNSGTKYAEKFSNKISSYQSSLGFYVTGNSYNGKHGNSLVLDGVEKGINDHAMQRAIVIHGADYVNPNWVQQQGYIGRSQGCPAVPNNQINSIINTIQGASCLFIYAPDHQYLQLSKLIH
jgi:hypothetical protein